MDYQIINWKERHYKTIVAIVVIIGSLALVFWSYKSEFDSTVIFFASILYALFLYLVSVFTNNTAAEIESHFTERADLYNKFKHLSYDIKSLHEEIEYIDRVNKFKELTGRRRIIGYYAVYNYKNAIPLSEQLNNKMKLMETQFQEKNTTICKRIEDVILLFDSIKNETEIQKKVFEKKPLVTDAISFSIKDWCSYQHFNVTSQEDFIKFYSSRNEISQINEDILSLREDYSELEKIYKKCEESIEKNIKRIKKTYGERLEYEVYRLQEVEETSWGIHQALNEKTDDITCGIDGVYNMTENIQNVLDDYAEYGAKIVDMAEKTDENCILIDQIQLQLKYIQGIIEEIQHKQKGIEKLIEDLDPPLF